MQRKRTLRNRVSLVLAAFATVVTIAVGVLGYMVNEGLEEAIWRATLGAELSHYFDGNGTPRSVAGPQTRKLKTYVSGENTPIEQQPPDEFRDLEPGLHDELKLGGKQYAVLIKDTGPNRIYMVYDITRLEEDEQRLIFLIGVGFALVSIFLALIGYWLAGLLSSPVRDLARRVRRFDPQSRGERVGRDYRDREIATIAEAIDGYMERLDGFVLREQEFTGMASHELRTPIAVIQNSTELIKMSPNLPHFARNPLARLEQATADMEETISVLLYLAREQESGDQLKGATRFDSVLVKAIKDHFYLKANKSLTFRINSKESTLVNVTAKYAVIVLNNIVRNAIEHTERGSIDVALRGGMLTVTNTNIELDADEAARLFQERIRYSTGDHGRGGLGLNIIRRLCERAGWQFSFFRNGDSTTVSLNVAATLVKPRVLRKKRKPQEVVVPSIRYGG